MKKYKLLLPAVTLLMTFAAMEANSTNKENVEFNHKTPVETFDPTEKEIKSFGGL